MSGDSMPLAGSPRWSRAVGVAVVDVPDREGPDREGPDRDVSDREGPAQSETPEIGGVVYLAPLPDGPVAVLSGASAVLFRALVARDVDPVIRVARDLGVPAEEVDPEAIQEFAEELFEGGFIVRRSTASDLVDD